MWIRRILFALSVLGLAGLAAWLVYFYEPGPDPQMACYYGAYRADPGGLIVVSPASGRQALRMVMMNGLTWRLVPMSPNASEVPDRFLTSPGWGEAPPLSPLGPVEFGSCADGTMTALTHRPPDLAARRETFDVTDATFESHGLRLVGRLVMPRLEGAIPVAVLIHGSERDSAVLFNRLQYLLPANGIGVFVYDKRGTGKSEGRYTQDFHLLSDDAAAALTKARAMAGTLASEVGFQGGSQAGWVIPLAARKTKADFAVVGYGLAESPLAEDREEVFDDLRRAGYGEDVIAKAREITDATARVMASDFTEGFDKLDAVRAKFEKEPWYSEIKGEFSGDFLSTPNWVLKIVGPWFDVGTSWTYDPVPALQAYKGPHLWILAGRDSSAPAENTLRVLRKVQSMRANLDIVVFPTADHGITEFEEKNGERVATRFSDGYFQLLADWILFKDTAMKVQGPIVYEGAAAATAPAPTP
jgi:uncharacterized protein